MASETCPKDTLRGNGPVKRDPFATAHPSLRSVRRRIACAGAELCKMFEFVLDF
jgi:hypothetical protein